MKNYSWSLILLFTSLCASVASAAELRDVNWKCKDRSCYLDFQFDQAGGLPSYFQKFDATRQVLRIGFSTTGIQVLPGNWVLDSQAKGLKSIQMKQETSARGVPLLVFEASVGSDISSDQNTVKLVGNSHFQIHFDTKSPSKTWSLVSAAKKAGEPTRTVEAKPAEKNAKASLVVGIPSVLPVTPTVASLPKSATLPSGLLEISWLKGYGVEQFILRFPEEAPAVFQITDSLLVIPLPKATKISQVVAAQGSSLVKEFQVGKATMNSFELIIRLKEIPVQVFTKGSRLWLQASTPTLAGLDQWTISPTGSKHRVYSTQNSEEELESLDQFAKGFKSTTISTSQTFLLRKASRDLIVVEDVVVLRDAPSEVGKQLMQLKFGDKLHSVELDNLYYKVKYKDVTGYVNRRMVSYPDELSHLQMEKLKELANRQMEATGDAVEAGIALPGDSTLLEFEAPDVDRITYSSFGRRDPFVQLEGIVNEGINIDGVELVGIIWDSEVPMVLLTDSRNPGVSYTLKEGDAILNGKVLKITQDEVLFLINEFGVSRRYTMTLPDKYGGNN